MGSVSKHATAMTGARARTRATRRLEESRDASPWAPISSSGDEAGGLEHGSPVGGHRRLTQELAPLLAVQSTPHTEFCASLEREQQAFGTNRATLADRLCPALRPSVRIEEQLGIVLMTASLILPRHGGHPMERLAPVQ